MQLLRERSTNAPTAPGSIPHPHVSTGTHGMENGDLARADKDVATAYEHIDAQRRLLLKLLRERRFKEAAGAHALLKTQQSTLDALRVRRRTILVEIREPQASWGV